MIRVIGFFIIVAMTPSVFASTELTGDPDDLRKFLYPSEKVVTIKGEAEEKAYSDKAIVSIVISTEDKLLSDSISKNRRLRKSISKKLR